ncbi:Chromosome partition protein Smc [Carpediemonas membranifera]|uniref:Chromosome partition protein Smc n=1 Tax=Carpediemonas membranifera TaxID=201153 RepID=A0A8J6BBJ5_9EUKA|nr:Chromosome partition protein Smc [Carpediemonas membranifera]|eukprot:KAG9396842.1 Chromosome partition protein Smc [Carpediemonas membranifera]
MDDEAAQQALYALISSKEGQIEHLQNQVEELMQKLRVQSGKMRDDDEYSRTLSSVEEELFLMTRILGITYLSSPSPSLSGLDIAKMAGLVRSSVETLAKEHNTLQTEYESLKQRVIDTMDEQTATAVVHNRGADPRSVATQGTKADGLRRSNAALQTALDQAELRQLSIEAQQSGAMTGVLNEAKEKIADLRKENDALHRRVDELTATQQANDRSYTKLASCETERDLLRVEIDRERAEKKEMATELKTTREKLDATQTENARLATVLSTAPLGPHRTIKRKTTKKGKKGRRAARVLSNTESDLMSRARAVELEHRLRTEQSKVRILADRLDKVVTAFNETEDDKEKLQASIAKLSRANNAESTSRKALQSRLDRMGSVIETVRGPRLADVLDCDHKRILAELDFGEADLLALE